MRFAKRDIVYGVLYWSEQYSHASCATSHTDIPQMILRYPLKSFSDHIFVLSPANTLNMLCVSTTPLRQAPATPAAPAAPAAADEDSDVELTFDEPMPRHSAGRRLHDSRL